MTNTHRRDPLDHTTDTVRQISFEHPGVVVLKIVLYVPDCSAITCICGTALQQSLNWYQRHLKGAERKS